MANICSNNFYVTADNKDTIQQVKDKFETLFVDKLIGDLSWVDDYFLEGYFDSKWVFPMSLFKDLFNDVDDDTLYMRCLSEEYGCGYVAMNIYCDGDWREEQSFNL